MFDSDLLDQFLADGDEFSLHALLSVGGSPRVVGLAVAGEVLAGAGVREDGCVLHLNLRLSLICGGVGGGELMNASVDGFWIYQSGGFRVYINGNLLNEGRTQMQMWMLQAYLGSVARGSTRA